MWFTPSSVVHYRLGGPITVEDIRLFEWRWNMRSILKGYLYFERKWGLDITEQGRFRSFLLHYNSQLGLLPRLFPSTKALRLDNGLARLFGGRTDRGNHLPHLPPHLPYARRAHRRGNSSSVRSRDLRHHFARLLVRPGRPVFSPSCPLLSALEDLASTVPLRCRLG